MPQQQKDTDSRTQRQRLWMRGAAALLLLIFIFTAGYAVGARRCLVPGSLNCAPASASQSQSDNARAVPGVPLPPRPQNVQNIKLGPNGFAPTEVTRSAGRFVLTVDLGGGFNEETVLEIKLESGERVEEMRVQRGALVWSKEIDLSAGRYTITAATHPDWLCRLNVQ